ncbi:MAG: DUF3014 domain-containing protein [Steroidobacteraceae bacterium]
MWNKTDPEESFRNTVIWVAAAVVAAALVGVGVYYRFHKPHPAAAAAPTTIPQAATGTPTPLPGAPQTPAVQNPVPSPAAAAASAKPLPPLNDSDAVVVAALDGLIGQPAVTRFLVPKNVIRRVVVTVDNLPRAKIAADLRPIQPTAGTTVVDRQGGITVLSARNYARYTPFVDVVGQLDVKSLAQLYFRLYPLFQQAYESLGYPGKYFNDRLVAAIDSMLATPTVNGPVTLVRPNVFWQYSDPKLEALPAGQKLLIRMGPQNAAVIEAKLRAFRALIAKPPQ